MSIFWLFYIIIVGAMVLSALAQLWALAVQLFILFVVISLGILAAKSMSEKINKEKQDYYDWHNTQ